MLSTYVVFAFPGFVLWLRHEASARPVYRGERVDRGEGSALSISFLKI